MATLPRQVLTQTEVTGPAGGRRATVDDFGGGTDTLIGATRAAANATRQSADSVRVRARGTRQAADAGLRADTAVAAGVDAVGRAVGQAGDELYRHEERKEQTDATARLAEGQAQWATSWDERLKSAQPGDTTLVSGFKKDFDAYSKDFAKGYKTAGGKAYAKEGLARLRGHFWETAAKGEALLAGAKQKADYINHQNASTTALLTDPDGLQLAMERHDEYLRGADKLSGEQKLELQTSGRSELARAAVLGLINRDFKDARDRLKAGEWKQFLDAKDTVGLIKAADAEERDQRIEKDRQEAERRKQLDESQKGTANGFVSKMAEGSLTPKEVIGSNLDWREKEHFLDAIERKSKAGIAGFGKEPPVDYALAQRLAERMASDNPPSRNELLSYLWKSADKDQNGMPIQGGINDTVFNHLEGMRAKTEKAEDIRVKTKVTQMKKAARSAIVGSNFLDPKDPESAGAYYRFEQDLDQTVEKYRAEGKDWRPLFDPKSPEFFGPNIQVYMATRDAMRSSLFRKLRGEAQVFGASGATRKSGKDRLSELMGTK